jgi:hypothetical protein
MIRIIEEHNVLTGHRFVIVEYVLVGLVLGMLGVWYAAVGRTLDAATWLGMTVNCAVIALLADAQLRSGASDFGTLPFRRPTFRREVLPSHPGLWRRMTALIVITFIPFAIAVLVLVETVRDALRGPAAVASRAEP